MSEVCARRVVTRQGSGNESAAAGACVCVGRGVHAACAYSIPLHSMLSRLHGAVPLRVPRRAAYVYVRLKYVMCRPSPAPSRVDPVGPIAGCRPPLSAGGGGAAPAPGGFVWLPTGPRPALRSSCLGSAAAYCGLAFGSRRYCGRRLALGGPTGCVARRRPGSRRTRRRRQRAAYGVPRGPAARVSTCIYFQQIIRGDDVKRHIGVQ